MRTGKTNLKNLEKKANNEPGNVKTNAILVDWKPRDGRTIEDQVKEQALETNEQVIFIYYGDKDEIQSYTYDPKLKRGWHN